jgi:RNA polymerase subunit RPABC4/transcription elongation factor Spt4
MIFIGGIQPKTVTVDDTPRICPACGLAQARLKRVDHYLSLFFIPVFRVKTGEPFIHCERCQQSAGKEAGPTACGRCGRLLDGDFQFCPYCGAPRHG